MKKFLSLVLCMLLCCTQIPAASAASDTFTLMIYLCGTDLESNGQAASADLQEMVKSRIPKNGDLTVYVQTGGTKSWHIDGISDRKVERWTVSQSGLQHVDSVGTANMGDADTLSDFIAYGLKHFPADRYGLIMWDHGGGASGGLCYDEMTRDALYYPEIYEGLKNAKMPKRFSFIGFDACLMSSYELANHIAPFADYMIASEELEPGSGWQYDAWLPSLASNPGISIPTLGKKIVDSFITSLSSGYSFFQGDYGTLSVCDLSKINALQSAVERMGSTLQKAVSQGDFATISRVRQSMRSFGEISDAASDMIDLTVFAESYARFDSQAAKSILSALQEVVVYSRHTSNLSGVSGLSILVPYSTRSSFSTYMPHYETLGLSPNYAAFVKSMASEMNGGSTGSLFGNLSIGQTSIENAQIDWFSQYAQDEDSYYESADSYWNNEDNFSLDGFLNSILGVDSNVGLNEQSTASDGFWGLWDSNASLSGSSAQSDSGLDAVGSWDNSSHSESSDLWENETGFWAEDEDTTNESGFLSGDSWTSPSDGGFWGSFTSELPYADDGAGVSAESGNSSLDSFIDSVLGISAPENTITIQTETGAVNLNNPFAGIDSEYAYTLALTSEQMQNLGRVEANLMMDVSDPDFECYVELGYVQDVIVDWDRGQVYGLFDGTWATLDGQMVCLYDQIVNERYTRSLIPVTRNGVSTYLLVIFDEETPTGRVVGTTEGYTDSGLPARGVDALELGDVIIPEYSLLYWDADGEQQEEPFEGDPITVGKDCSIPFGFEPVESDADYCYGFCLTDIYGDSTFSDFTFMSF